MNAPIKIYDTTLRDGAQTMGVAFSLADKLHIAQELDELGVHYIEGGWPGSNPKDIAFFFEIAKLQLKNAKVTAFSSTRLKGVHVAADANIRQLVASKAAVATVFGKSWDLHVHKALATSLDENLEMILSTVSHLKDHFAEVIFDAEHFFDGFAANADYAIRTLLAAEEGGADWIVLCDTNGGAMNKALRTAIEQVHQEIHRPLGIHTHNDSELAVANSLAAVEMGIGMVQGTINGLGERCGNANLCSLIPNLSLKLGHATIPERSLSRLTVLSRLVAELANMPHPSNLPYAGDHAFAHKGGVHVSAVRRDARTYEHVQPELIGNRRMISVSELSGRGNILEKARELGIQADSLDPLARSLLKQVKEMEAQGYHFEGADASLELLFLRLLGRLKTYFNLKGYRVITWKNGCGPSSSETTIKADVPEAVSRQRGLAESQEHTSADGNGPVEALDKALHKVLEKFYPRLREVRLVDFKVRILNPERGTGATTRVIIHSADRRRRWATVGVSDNIIDASWQALTDALVYKLLKDESDGTGRSNRKQKKENNHEQTNQAV